MPERSERNRRALDGWGRFKVAMLTFGLYALGLPILLFHILLLIGCATDSPGMANIYVAELDEFSIKFSYTSLCAPSQTGRSCGPSVGKSARVLVDVYNLTVSQADVQYALDLQTNISFVIPAMSAVLFCFSLFSLMGARSVVKRGGTNTRFHIASIACLFWASAGVAFAAAYALTSAVAALSVQGKDLPGSTWVSISAGKVMLALQWMTFVFSLIAAFMSGGITTTFLGRGAGRRREARDGSPPRRPSFARQRSMGGRPPVSHAPPYSREAPRGLSPVSPI